MICILQLFYPIDISSAMTFSLAKLLALSLKAALSLGTALNPTLAPTLALPLHLLRVFDFTAVLGGVVFIRLVGTVNCLGHILPVVSRWQI